SEEEAYDVQPLTAEAVETYEPQWGIAEEETESEESPSETEEEAYDLQPLTAEASETYEPQWGIAEEEESEAESPDSDERGYDLPPLQVGASEPYEPQWGAVLDENSAENIAYSDTQENLEEPYEPRWGAATTDDAEAPDQPAMSSPEGSTGELDDMSWLTDDIFAETRGLKPADAEATGNAVFEQQAQSDDEPSHEDLLASQQAEPDAVQEARDEDFLASLQDEEQVETPADSQLLDAIGDEQAAEPENSEDFIAAMDMLEASGHEAPQAEFDVESRRA